MALDILLIVAEEFFDGGSAGGRRTEATFLHRFGEGFVVDELTRVFHRAEQRGFVVTRGGLRRVLLDVQVNELGLGGVTVGGAERR